MLIPPKPVDAAVMYEPLYTQLMSLTVLGSHTRLSGLSQWSIDTAEQMSPAERNIQNIFHWLNLDGFVNLIRPENMPQSVPELVDLLQSVPADTLRDQLFTNSVNAVHFAIGSDYWLIPISNPTDLLNDYAAFKSYFQELTQTKYDASEMVDVHLIFTLLNDPPQLQQALISHLNMLWHRFLEREWRTFKPQIQACVDAFQSIPLSGLTMLEAIEAVTGRNLRPAFRLDKLLEFDKVRFVPHIHNGPYIIWFGTADTLVIGFPARTPETDSPAFDTTTFVNRCKALADENRVAILLALAQEETLSTADLIERFDLDKSAASRHLRQLVANSLINEKRIDKAKKGYQLNKETLAELANILNRLA